MRTYTIREALMLVLDQVDYVRGNCGLTEMVGACLPKEIIAIARKALEDSSKPLAVGQRTEGEESNG
jgi:hypothetical protein